MLLAKKLVHTIISNCTIIEATDGNEAIEEYKKFMYLAATSNQMVSPSEIVDIVWHQHLIFTQSYKEFCDILGKKIEPVMIIFCSSSLTSPVRRLREYWKVYEGDNAFEFVKLLTGFDLLSYFKQEDKLIREIMDKIFDMM